MNKEWAEAYIAEIPRFTTKNSLEHTREFLARLGNPEKDKKIIHVAGTNGKGSVCAYVQAVLLAKGKRTGMFISPHLVQINERVKVNGIDVSDEAFLEAFQVVKQVVDEMEREGIAHPSYFEFLFGIGMYVFGKANVEYIVLETGLGGRLDATNAILHPTVTVITSISLDHTDILGDTIEQIAAEKAGILKKRVPVVCLGNRESTPVIEAVANTLEVPVIRVSEDCYEIEAIHEKSIDFSIPSAYSKSVIWTVHNTGIYQVENATLAIEALRVLFPEETDVTQWVDAIGSVRWQGRMEEIMPGVIVDGAHNVGAMEAFAKSLRRQPEEDRVILFSAVSDKDYEKMIAILCRDVPAKAYVITKIQDTRGADPEAIAAAFRRETTAEVLVEEDFTEAFRIGLEKRGREGRLYCLGSLYLVGMLEAWKET